VHINFHSKQFFQRIAYTLPVHRWGFKWHRKTKTTMRCAH